MEITLHHYLLLSGLLFTIGVLGVLLRQNILIILLSLEIMINSGNLALIAFTYYKNLEHGQVMVLFSMALAAIAAGIALAIIVLLYRKRGTISTDDMNLLNG